MSCHPLQLLRRDNRPKPKSLRYYSIPIGDPKNQLHLSGRMGLISMGNQQWDARSEHKSGTLLALHNSHYVRRYIRGSHPAGNQRLGYPPATFTAAPATWHRRSRHSKVDRNPHPQSGGPLGGTSRFRSPLSRLVCRWCGPGLSNQIKPKVFCGLSC